MNNRRKENPFRFREPLQEANENLKKTIAFLARHKISPTPVNYTVGYDLSAGRHEALSRELERRSARSGIVDDHLLAELFDEFYLTPAPGEAVEGHLHDIGRILADVISGVASASDAAASYSDQLTQHLDALVKDGDPANVERIVKDLIRATESAMEDNRKLHGCLEEVQDEAKHLRQELDRVRKETLLDPLTGLFNRRMLTETLEEQIGASREGGTPLSVLMVDIDHFKRFNDTFGHLVGDEVIRRVAATVKKHIRGTDLAARYGGEEFVVVLPETALPGAQVVAKNVHGGVAKLQLIKKSTQEKLPGITISAGIATLREGDDSEGLIERADRALYLAKECGRNRVLTEQDLEDRATA